MAIERDWPPCRKCGCGERYRYVNGKVECVACRRAANSAAERRRRDRRAAKALDFEITPAMRSYLAAFDAWLRAEDPFSLRRLERRRAVALGAMVADSRQRRAAG